MFVCWTGCPITFTLNWQVCELHFNHEEIIKFTVFPCENGEEIKLPIQYPKLACGAVPTVLPNCPSYLSKNNFAREGPEEKKRKRENKQLVKALEESANEFQVQVAIQTFTTLGELKDKLRLMEMSQFWDTIIKNETVSFVNLKFVPFPKIMCSVVIECNLDVYFYLNEVQTDSIGNYELPKQVNSIDELRSVLLSIEINLQCNTECEVSNVNLATKLLKSISFHSSDLEMPINFVIEQLEVLSSKRNNYSPSFLVFSSMLFHISPHCYRFIRSSGCLVLPHPSTIQRRCSSFTFSPHLEQHDGMFLRYIRNKFSGRREDQLVSLMMDEIHIKPMMDYKGGNIVGGTCHNEKLATSAYCFMISSFLSNFKEVVHIMPVKTVSGDMLHHMLRKVIAGLEEVGFNVIAVLSDNNAINRKCMQLFSSTNELTWKYPHPVDSNRPLFFILDSVHIFKCVRNNWINKKNETVSMKYPDFDLPNGGTVQEASFIALRKFYELEQDKLLKYGYGLSVKALYPTSFERQNVKLVLQIFNEKIIEGLTLFSKKHGVPHVHETAKFIRIILNWWDVVNVKSTTKGLRKNNVLMCPITNDASDERVFFLKKFLVWLQHWKDLHLKESLTKETMDAIILTTNGLLQLQEYCFTKLNFSYFLSGKLQTDMLENRFGQYRQLAGGQYNISMRQVYEVEKKLRMQDALSMKLKSQTFGKLDISDFEDIDPQCETFSYTSAFEKISISESDIEKCTEDLPILMYISGYCCFVILKKSKCTHCRDILVSDETLPTDNDLYSLINAISRGKLMKPEMSVVTIILHHYVLIQKILSSTEREFLKVSNQREVLCEIGLSLICDHELLWEPDVCLNGHTAEDICRKLLWVSTNILLNNYCKKRNSEIRTPSSRKTIIFSSSSK